MRKYIPKEIESKWQKKWNEQGIYSFKSGKNKYYNLVEFPYPSGDLHLGHWFTFSPADAHARYKKMKGFSVFFPNGFDAFGLPAENAAIKRGIHPRDWTLSNVEAMTKQFGTMGTMIDWNYKVITCLPDYYKWNQWIFIKMFEGGLAYRGKTFSNWCPIDQTVLANEHVEAGRCWRCGTEVVQKEIEQWFLKITDYAEDLIWPDPTSPALRGINWPKSVREGQNNWIGRSEGLLIEFKDQSSKIKVQVFTTRPETIDGATFVVLSPEVGSKFKIAKSKEKDVRAYLDKVLKKTEMERKEEKVKTGVFTGVYVTNPVTKKKIPVWIADYVLGNVGTGAIMAVPGEDERDREFAKKLKLSIIKSSLKAKPQGEKKVYYHLRDWSVSRQRYWGTPVPMIHCRNCGIVPVPLKDLPVELPYEVDYAPKGKPPLASATKWMKVKCPKCSGEALRDPETLDTFFDSSWYLWRYTDPKNEKQPFDKLKAKELMPVDVYFGGAEHTLGHTLYARFFTKFFKDIGLTNLSEFAKKRIQHGVILGPDGFRMSKSRGNVVNPDDLVAEYGADTVRTYLCFMMPYETTAPFSTGGISGVYRFLKRIWELQEKVSKAPKVSEVSKEDKTEMNKTIKKVGEDLENFHFNTAIATLMSWLNHLSRKERISKGEYETFVKLLAPFAPHISSELFEMLGNKTSIHLEKWPEFDTKFLKSDKTNIAVQVNGKLRATLTVQSSRFAARRAKLPASPKLQRGEKVQSYVEEKAKELPNVKKHLIGKKVEKVIYVEGKVINFVAI